MAICLDGGVDAFDAMVGGRPSTSSSNWLQQTYNQAMSFLDAGKQAFVEKAQQVNRIIDGFSASQLKRNIMSKIKGYDHRHDIMPLRTVDAFQTAGPIMQRWIMAHEDTRRAWQDNRLDGYNDTYKSNEPDRFGEDQFDWRKAMSGVFQFDNDNNAYIRHYYQLDEEPEMSLDDKFTIQDVWNTLERLSEEQDEDLTSIYSAKT